MFHGKDQMKVIVVFDNHPRTHLGCWNCHVLNSLLERLLIGGSLSVFCGKRQNRQPVSTFPGTGGRRTKNFTSNLHLLQPLDP
jgi:hypothetical protein